MSRYEKPVKYDPELETTLKTKETPEIIGHHDIDTKYLGKCSNFFYEYDECLRDCDGDSVYCDKFRKSLQRCEEESGMYEDVLNTLGIEPETRGYKKYTYQYAQVTEGSIPEIKRSYLRGKSRDFCDTSAQIRENQLKKAKSPGCAKSFFHKEDPGPPKEKSLKNSEGVMQRNSIGKPIKLEPISTQETFESSNEASFSRYNDVSIEEKTNTREKNGSFSLIRNNTFDNQSEEICKGKRIRMPKNMKIRFKSSETTNERNATNKVEEREEESKTPTSLPIVPKFPTALPISSAVFISKGYRALLKYHRSKKASLGSKTPTGCLEENKSKIFNFDFKSGDSLNPLRNPLKISNIATTMKHLPTSKKTGEEIPSMIECLRKNSKRGAGTPTDFQHDHQILRNIDNYYKPSQTPLLRSIKKTLDERNKTEQSIIEYSLTDPDEIDIRYTSNKSFESKIINLPSRKTSNNNTLKDKFGEILNQMAGSNQTGVKINRMKIIEEKSSQEKNYDQFFSCPLKKAMKPTISSMGHVHQSRA